MTQKRPARHRRPSPNTNTLKSSAADLTAEALAIREFGAGVIDATDIGVYAIEYAIRNWPVFPLIGKVPAIPKTAGGRGVLDATTDANTVIGWWAGRYAGCNIGGRVPVTMFVFDTDPRHGGLESLAALQRRYGALPETLTTLTGRGDGGWHRFYRRPPGKLSAARLGPGIDIKTSLGYVVLPPSTHPDTGKPYVRIDAPVITPPAWLTRLLCGDPVDTTKDAQDTKSRRHYDPGGESTADTFTAGTSWAEILHPHGWRCLDADADADGSRWRHPNATAAWSATVKHGCLFVYSPNTPFEVTEAGDPHGYTRFHAYAVLEHDGDMSAAAIQISQLARETA
jgi:hypothetical protein